MTESKKKILIIDDTKFVREILKYHISNVSNVEVIGEASNGNEGIELFNELKPDLTLMDLLMPEKGGLETTQEILKINPEALIVLISGKKQEAFTIKKAIGGVVDVIEKPFNEKRVKEVIERVFNKEMIVNNII
jgi:two-component system chemotaxis response regulator CheY